MSAELFTVPFQCVVVNGLAVPGATITFYDTETTTKLPIYTTADLTTQRTNPVVANGAGNIPATYLDTNETYRIVIKNKAGTVVDGGDIDPYIPGITTLGITLTSASGQAVNSRGALAALSPVINNQVAFLTEAGREGMFVFSTANLATAVTNDPALAIYVAPASAATGASGAWVRRIPDLINVKWFGATGDGSTNDTTAIQRALDYINYIGGGTLYFPEGTYKVAAYLTIYKQTKIKGAGRKASIITTAMAGGGGASDDLDVRNGSIFYSNWASNSSTAVDIAIDDIGLTCTNGANVGAGFYDNGGTFIHIRNVFVEGFRYGVVLDQSELVDIDLCDFESQGIAAVWLVNADDLKVGNTGEFTNRISINRSQFNQAVSSYGILDDGGNAHAFSDNNYNACLNHIRAAGVTGLKISGGEFESASDACIVFTNLTLAGGAAGPCSAVYLGDGAELVPGGGQACVSIISLGSIVINSVYCGNTVSAKFTGTASANVISAMNVVNAGGGATFDGMSTSHFEVCNDGTTFAIRSNLPITAGDAILGSVTMGAAEVLTLNDSSGAGYEAFVERVADSPHRILRVASKGGTGGWEGSFRVQLSTDVNALFDAFKVDSSGTSDATADIKTAYKVAGVQALTVQQTGLPAAASDLATAITLVNFLRTACATHGFVAT